MSLANAQRDGFDRRLSKIRKGGANTMGEVHIGPRDEVRAGKKGESNNTVRMKRKKSAKSATIGEGSTPVLMVLGLLFGAMSMFVGQATAFHLFDAGGLMPLTLPEAAQVAIPYASLIIGGTLAMMFAWTFRLTTALRMIAVAVGLYGMVYFHTDLVGKMPGLYTNFFTKEYVTDVLAKA